MRFKSIHHADRETIGEMYNDYSPVFILSTGRSGSKFTARLLDQSPNVGAYHEPEPMLQYFSNYAFHHQNETEILEKMIDAARMELILAVFIKDRIYIESNQCLSFFAPVIARLFKKAKFVHLVRHPGDFARSAVRKGWHKNDSIWESGRVRPAARDRWDTMDHIEKLGWLWDTTNRFIKEFMHRIEPGRTALFKMEDLFSDAAGVKRLFQFAGAEDIPVEKIREIQATPVNELIIHPGEPPNMKKVAVFPRYNQWDGHMKDKLKAKVNELADYYKYDL
ncbi:MAG: sulfotransferase [bacterium]|nr:sulfotransferase [bacterium]